MKKNLLILAGMLFITNFAHSQAVGIGDVSFTPNYLLQIHRNAASGVALQLTNTTTGALLNDGFQLFLNGAAVELINRENADMSFFTNNTDRGRFTSSGVFRVNNLAGVGNRMILANATGDLTIVTAGSTGQVLTQTAGGPAWQTGGFWGLTGNAGTVAGTNFVGTTDNIGLDFRTNNTNRIRIYNTGLVQVGAVANAAGDFMLVTGNTTNPWSLNATSGGNGGAGYFEILSGNTTNFSSIDAYNQGSGAGNAILGTRDGTSTGSGVSGMTNSTNVQSSGVRGTFYNALNGTGFSGTLTRAAVRGEATQTGTYNFGTMGFGGISTRSGGVVGYDQIGATVYARGALGYWGSAGDFSVYGFGLAYTTGVATGMLPTEFNLLHPYNEPLPSVNSHTGLGIYGGMMGGWIRGLVYGTHLKGDKYSLYVDGKTLTNHPISELMDNGSDKRAVGYAQMGLSADLTFKGKSRLQNGYAKIELPAEIHTLLMNDQVIVTVTPTGKCNGLYIEESSNTSFVVRELGDGASNVGFHWIVVGERKINSAPISKEILAGDFDKKMNGVMFNDANTEENAQPMWWDGKQMRFESMPEDVFYEYKGKHIEEQKKINEQNMPAFRKRK